MRKRLRAIRQVLLNISSGLLLTKQFTQEMFVSSLKFVHKLFIRYCPSTSKGFTCIFRQQRTSRNLATSPLQIRNVCHRVTDTCFQYILKYVHLFAKTIMTNQSLRKIPRLTISVNTTNTLTRKSLSSLLLRNSFRYRW